MSNTVKGVLWGVLGAAFALVLSLGAFAVAGDSIGDPAEPIPVPSVTSSERNAHARAERLVLVRAR